MNNKEQKIEKQTNVAGLLKGLDKVSVLRTDWLITNIPFFMFLVCLAIFYIWNNHHGIKMVKDQRATEQKMIETQWFYNSTKDSLTQHSRQSTIAEMVKDQGMLELSSPVYTIISK